MRESENKPVNKEMHYTCLDEINSNQRAGMGRNGGGHNDISGDGLQRRSPAGSP